jgi:hypothetical protein
MRYLMRNRRLQFVAVALLSAFVSAGASAQATRSNASSTESKFLRFVADNDDGGKLEASVVTYRNSDGAAVDLIAAVHIADVAFFRDLDKSFAQYDALLYEMVKPKDMKPQSGRYRPHRKPGETLGWVTVLQQFMKDFLELSFQLEQIDYTAPNFVHADLDVETFAQMQADRGESLLMMMFQLMLREMAKGEQGMAAAAAEQPDLLAIVEALQSPDRARQLKLVLARSFNAMDEMLSGLGGARGTVILDERNRAAMRVLKQRLEKGDKKLGIFYGAGHLKGMEKILTEEMGFKQAGEPKWYTAWDMTK